MRNNTSVVTSTIMFLILPLLILFGLVPLTRFAFSADNKPMSGTSSDWNINIPNPFVGGAQSTRSISLSEREIMWAKVSVVSTWILVILSILSWIGRAFGLFCIP
jgi:hypothetical protein